MLEEQILPTVIFVRPLKNLYNLEKNQYIYKTMSSVSNQNSWLKYLNSGLPRTIIIQLGAEGGDLNLGPTDFKCPVL